MDSALKLKNGMIQVLSEGNNLDEKTFNMCIKRFLISKKFVSKPVLRVTTLSGTCIFKKDDLKKVFEHFGKIVNVLLTKERNVGFVFMESFKPAFEALKFLHQKQLKISKSRIENLKINFLKVTQNKELEQIHEDTMGEQNAKDDQEEIGTVLKLRKKSQSCFDTSLSTAKEKRYSTCLNLEYLPRSLHFSPSNVCKVNSSASKFTCKYEIHYHSPIAAHEFQLAKRIIGPKGSNMKSIIEVCFNGKKMIPDYLKLRLRGRDSGFREGPMKQECDEPLHLCVSARDIEMYNKAAQMSENLLIDVFTRFKKFLMKRDKENFQIPLIIKRESHISNTNNQIIFPKNYHRHVNINTQQPLNLVNFEKEEHQQIVLKKITNKKSNKRRRRKKNNKGRRKIYN